MIDDLQIGEVRLIWSTPNVDQMIANMARVSAPANWGKEPDNLIGYLLRNKHWSPFEMANVCVALKTTRTIGRQFLRHQLKPQEFSQRYAEVDTGFTFSEARLQDQKNRQNSLPTDNAILHRVWKWQQVKVASAAADAYEWAIANGIAKEVARNVLPEGMTPTIMIFNGYLRNWLHFCELRCGHGTQKEATAVAEEIWKVLKSVAPITCEAFEKCR